MNLKGLCALLLAVVSSASLAAGQGISSTYLDLPVQGKWQPADKFSSSQFGSELYYESVSGSVVQIRALAGMQKVAEITRFFRQTSGPATVDAAQVFSSATFSLPRVFSERASQDLAKGSKPPRLWELKDGEGNPVWFYASQLFSDFRVRQTAGSFEIDEQYSPARVVRAEHRTVRGGDALLLEAETERPASDAALKRFKMPVSLKDQKIRFGWVQFAPGGVGAGQGVLSVAFAAPANSPLTSDDLLQQIASAQLKPMD